MRKVYSEEVKKTSISKHHYYVLTEEERFKMVGLLFIVKKYGADMFDLDQESREFVNHMMKGFGE